MRKGGLSVAVFTAALLSASTVRAQCAAGRTVTEASAGRCCWPGQSWNDDAARCEGPPACPAGMAAEGDSCVPFAPASPPPVAEPVAPPVASAPQPVYLERPSFEPPRPREDSEPIMGLFIAGVSSLAATYLATVVYTTFALTSCCAGDLVAINYIPVVGPIIWTPTTFDGYYGSPFFYFPSAIIQAVTFALTLAGLVIKRPSRPRDVASLLLPELVGGPGEIGLGLRWAL
ncbi:MAG: hypothetical protein AB7S26_11490 [Sandaracinaceae bacterium]